MSLIKRRKNILYGFKRVELSNEKDNSLNKMGLLASVNLKDYK